jgi:hypothetical protein
MMKSGKRKMLAAREDLADKVAVIASSKGFTLFGMVNSLLELAVNVDAMGTSLDEAVDNQMTIKAVKNASFTLVLESLLYETADIAYQKAKEKTVKTWFDAGVWIGRQYISKGVEDPFTAVKRDLKAFGWNTPEFMMERIENKASIRVLSPRFSESYTVLFNRFLEGILEAFSYSVTYREVGRGNIRLEASKKEAENGGKK